MTTKPPEQRAKEMSDATLNESVWTRQDRSVMRLHAEMRVPDREFSNGNRNLT